MDATSALDVRRSSVVCPLRASTRWIRGRRSEDGLIALLSQPMRRICLIALLSLASCARCADWGRHDAYRQCSAAIAAFPAVSPPTCEAMHLCANEASLTPAERKKLSEMVSDAGCPPL